jgi:putative membrane protein
MLSYNPKEWIVFIFRFHKSDTFRKLLPAMLAVGGYATLIAYLELDYWQLGDNPHLKNINLMHSMLGFVISLLLVFRTNTAYDRWWEGRKLWGSLVNNSRNLSMKLSAVLAEENDRLFFKKAVPLFADALMHHLRKTPFHFEGDADWPPLKQQGIGHRPNEVARLMYQKVLDLHSARKLSSEQLLFLNAELQSFAEVCGACERIRNTPIPYSYSAFIKKFIFFYVLTLPLGFVFSLGYAVVPVVVFIFYVLASLELIAEEIEDPFGTDENDLPLEQIAENIRCNVADIL